MRRPHKKHLHRKKRNVVRVELLRAVSALQVEPGNSYVFLFPEDMQWSAVQEVRNLLRTLNVNGVLLRGSSLSSAYKVVG